jgi:hypothetical protein
MVKLAFISMAVSKVRTGSAALWIALVTNNFISNMVFLPPITMPLSLVRETMESVALGLIAKVKLQLSPQTYLSSGRTIIRFLFMAGEASSISL